MTIYNYFNNTGGLNKAASMASINETEISTEWSDSQNVEGYLTGGIIKMKGNKNICNTVLPANTNIIGIYEYAPNGESSPVIVCSNGKLYSLNITSGLLNELYSGISSSSKPCFTQFNNGVIITNGVDKPLFYEKNKPVEMLSNDAPIGRAVEVYKSRLFIGEGSTLKFSALGNPKDWTTPDDAGYISNFYNDASPIIALKVYGDYLAIYKQNGTYILAGNKPSEYVIQPVADKGAVSPQGVITINNNQFFFEGRSITPLKFNEMGQVRLDDDISFKIKPLFSSLIYNSLENSSFVHNKSKNQIWLYVSSGINRDVLDICYIYDYFLNAWYIRKQQPVTCVGLIQGNIYTGTADGKILLEDYGDNFDGNPIEAWWYSPWFSFGQAGSLKELNNLNIWLYQYQKYPLNLLYSKNFSDTLVNQSVVEVYASENLLWDDNEWDLFSWSDEKPSMKSVKIPGKFNSLKIGVKNMEADQPFSIIGYSFDVDTAFI